MSNRRRTDNPLESVILLFVFLAGLIIMLLVRLTELVYDLITFYTSKYKEKSGNKFFGTYFDKGNYGEFVLYRKMTKIFGQEYVLTNIYLDNKNTETTEIDVLAISSNGIYVFEMKNYAGYIYGSGNDQYWTQVLNRWAKNRFYNPLKQNYAHTKAVEAHLEISGEQIVPIVVFSDRSKLSEININDTQNVFQFRNMKKFVKKREKKHEKLLSNEQIEVYLIKLLNRCNMPEEVKTKHIIEVQELQKLNV
ncbi:MAG: nuclease-related domain-containing protein [Bacilli bacterium]|nr:nuclease-related domain-containing protein [Bacilli bacterium]